MIDIDNEKLARAIDLVARRWRENAALPVEILLDGAHLDVRDFMAAAADRDDVVATDAATEATGAPLGASVALVARLLAARAEIDFSRLRPMLPPAPDVGEINRELAADLADSFLANTAVRR